MAAGLDAAQEAIAHHQIVSCTELFQKARNVAEIVAVVRVAHDYILAAGGEITAIRALP